MTTKRHFARVGQALHRPLEVRAEASAAATTDRRTKTKVYLYSAIGDWYGMTSAQDLADVLAEIDTDVIELHVNSPGGGAFEGITMANLLRDHKAHVIAVIDGLAASAASMVIMGADEVHMAPGAELMIHDASMITWGNADQIRKDADSLDKLSQNYARAYARRAGGEPDAWRELMRAETWYLDTEAVEAGLADRALAEDEAEEDVDTAKAMWDTSIFHHAGRSDAPAPPALQTAAAGPMNPRSASAAGSNPPAAAAPSGDTMKEESMPLTDAQFAALAQKVGVPADADADTLLAAVDEALAEQADDRGNVRGLAPGTRVIDEATYDSLVERASTGDQALAAQAQARRESTVDAAVNEGRIPPARREHWLAQMQADEEGAGAVLAQLAAGTIPLTETGHADTITESDEDSPEYAAVYPAAKEA